MKKRFVLIVALMLGLTSAIAVYGYLQKSEKSKVAQVTTRVVVAAKEIAPKEQIKIDQLVLKEVPRDLAHFEAATSFDQVVGQYARERILAGEQVLKPRLIKGFEDYGIVIKIPAGYRAMAIPVDKTVGVAGFVRPGDLVDIVAGFNETVMGKNMAKVILEKVLVLATDQELSEEKRKPEDAKTVTVAVTPKQAEELSLALDHGTVRLALRPLESVEGPLTTEPVVGDGVALADSKQNNLSSTGNQTGTAAGGASTKQKSIFKPDPVVLKDKPAGEKQSIFKPANTVTVAPKPTHDVISSATSTTDQGKTMPLAGENSTESKSGITGSSAIGSGIEQVAGNLTGTSGTSTHNSSLSGNTSGSAGNAGQSSETAGNVQKQQYTIEIIRGTERVQVTVMDQVQAKMQSAVQVPALNSTQNTMQHNVQNTSNTVQNSTAASDKGETKP